MINAQARFIYPIFVQEKQYSPQLQDCIQRTVDHLLSRQTNVTNPGMLLGMIQSGKTRTFIGVIALAFDKGYDICVVFTKGTNALAEQTYQRLNAEFREFINDDIVKVYDIMNIPAQLTPYILRQKLIIVVKKQTYNLDRLVNFFSGHPDLADKKTLIIDDEADIASIGFRRDPTQQDGVSMNVLATKINNIRAGFANNYDFLQVTATPYALYLQPRGGFELNNDVFEPIRPAFTTLVPIYQNYIGGKEYFDLSQDPRTLYSHLHIIVPDIEISVLGKRDQRYIGNILRTPNLRVFRQSIVNYLVAGSIRLIQSNQDGRNYKSSFIIHTATQRGRHQWQADLTEALINGLKRLAAGSDPLLSKLVTDGYNNLAPSIAKNSNVPPDLELVKQKVEEALREGMVGVIKINSESEVAALLDRNTGQLRLDNPYNIFIGGQILDRGLTIENLIGFFMEEIQVTFNKTQSFNIRGCTGLARQWTLQSRVFTLPTESTRL